MLRLGFPRLPYLSSQMQIFKPNCCALWIRAKIYNADRDPTVSQRLDPGFEIAAFRR
jgi:hypothetical protein